MTDSLPSPQPRGTQITTASFIQIPSQLLQYVRSLKLTGTQYDLWLYLFQLDPYGDRFVEVPSPKEIANALQVDYRTIERAAQRLADCNLFEFEIERWKARNRKALSKTVLPDEHFASESLPGQASMSFPHFSLGKEIQNWPNRSKCGQTDPNAANEIPLPKENKTLHPKPAQGKGSKNDSVPIVLKTCSETTEQPFVGNEQKKIGTLELISRVQNAGIKLNRTIQKVIGEIYRQDPAAAARTVENALSAVAEQVSQGNVRNPGGLLVTALRQGYTSRQNSRRRRIRSVAYCHPHPPISIRLSLPSTRR
jgi:hypothetical protein